MNAASHTKKASRGAKHGFTLMELAITIIVIALLSAFALVSFGNSAETRDAIMVQSAQAALQSVVSQGSARMDVPPSQLNSASVLNALRASFNTTGTGSSGVQFSASGSSFVMNIPSGGRAATFSIGASGDVNLSALSNFQTYQVQNGIISKI